MKRSLGLRMGVVGGLLALLIGLAFAALIAAVGNLRSTTRLERHSQVVIAAAGRAEKLVLDLETGQRGFLIARDERFLTPWLGARAALPAQLRELRRLVAENPRQRAAVDRIETKVQEYLTAYSEPLVRLVRTNPAASRRVVKSGAGKRRVDELRRRFRTFLATEVGISRKRADRSHTAATRAVALGIGGLVGCVALVLLYVAGLARGVTRPVGRVAAAADRLAAGDLSARVKTAGDDEIGRLGQSFNAMAGALQESRSELENTSSMKRAVIESVGDAIALFGPGGETILANTAMLRLREAVAGGELAADAESAAMLVTRPAAGGGTFGEVVLHAAGHSFMRFATDVKDADGSPIGRLLVVRDVTAERLADRAKSDFLANVSHELRTPLASIVGFAELLATRELDAETRARFTRTILAAGRNLTALIGDFLDLQRVDRTDFEPGEEPFDLAELLGEQTELYSGQSAEHDIQLRVPPGPLNARGDRERFGQVIGNLISNAIKYSPGGGRVEVVAQARAGTVGVSVRDHGMGIPAAQQERVFEKFFRARSDSSRGIAGTGLGLALARQIVEAHGGRIGFESTEGEGSRFWFEAPAVPAGVPVPDSVPGLPRA